MAVAGVAPLTIMQRAGHRNMSTTMGYSRLAGDVGQHFGEPFPPLPRALLEGKNAHINRTRPLPDDATGWDERLFQRKRPVIVSDGRVERRAGARGGRAAYALGFRW